MYFLVTYFMFVCHTDKAKASTFIIKYKSKLSFLEDCFYTQDCIFFSIRYFLLNVGFPQ